MLVKDVIKNVQDAKLLNHTDDEINATLARMGKGKFTLKEKFGLAVLGVDTKDMQDMANCAKQVADADFGGDPKAAINFMNQLGNSGLAKLDFNQMVHNGTAHQLIAMSKTDPAQFQRVINGNYPDVKSLDQAIGTPAPKVASAAPQLRPAAPAMS
jgi:hypothetical protein